MDSLLTLLNELERIEVGERTGELRLVVAMARDLVRSGKADLAFKNLCHDLLDLGVSLGEEVDGKLERIGADLGLPRGSLLPIRDDLAAEACAAPRQGYSEPLLARRVAAKLIDCLAAGVTVVAVWFATGSYLAGLTVGWGWFAISDWSGSLGKWCLGLDVTAGPGGGPCSLLGSALRNLPLMLLALPDRLHQAVLDMDRSTYETTHPRLWAAATLVKCVGYLVLLIWLARCGRTLGDLLAGTRVRLRPRALNAARGAAPWLGVAGPVAAGLLVLALEWLCRTHPP
jgi:uncharacterized RDD family membrane protein YckC